MAELNGAMEEQKVTNNDRFAEVVRWERFLPRMVLRVLLVEADHSTRHIITALLRKCSYSVIAVPDGLKAWETLKRKAPDLDLILTEVELPAISGFALLSLIMEHDTCKNIPVIMMSSHDSVSMVLKCMLKGAVDFLIKPIRRNELRNLWQHVWRRHAITAPTHNTTFSPKKLQTASEDNSASNKSSGFVASSKKNNECSERLSEAQDAYQLKSSKLSKIDMVKHEEFTEFERESAKHNDDTGDKSITIVTEAAWCDKTFELTDLTLEQDHGCAESENKDEILKSESGRDNPSSSTEIHGCSDERVEPSNGAIDLIATFGNPSKHPDENCCLKDGNTIKFDCDAQLELSLKSDFPGGSCKQASEATEESPRLNHSNTSAFSWYTNSKSLQPLFPTPTIASAKVNNPNWDSHESYKLSVITSGNGCQYGGSNQNLENMISTVIGQNGQVKPKLSNSQCGLLPVSGVISNLNSKGHGNVFPSVFYAQPGFHPMWNPKPVCQNESSPFPTSNSSQSNPESNNSDQHPESPKCLNQNVKDNNDSDHARHDSPAAERSLCHETANHVSISAYGSMESANDGNATSAIVSNNNPEGFSDSGCHNYDGFRVTDSHHSSQREAALTKFRLKRKERCFEKKVRYQKRKRLAEQRPRVKGQFVRQVHNDHPVAEAGGDS
ncbi:two-component response regulator-like APRR9 isoform X2 [Cajanus cajan]|uniref:two-component response regulator-like APRR9 isoform X2 n=1 Tax=Cajanus cajan TaxID=3821 RepID=UPI00098DBBC8|nr:two-component response regulator-like APRR9 isoform X2 [Cajanus cajan]